MDHEVKEDRLLGGRVRVLQPTRGYRAGMDAALLAAACPARPKERIIEAGCGVGSVLIQIASRCPDARLVGLERDTAAAALARANTTSNGMGERIEILEGDVAAGFKALNQTPVDWAISNPPFFDDDTTLRAPAAARRGAWIADDGLSTWTGFLLKATREGGSIMMIHRADRLAEILGLLAPKAGSFQIRPIHPFDDRPAKRVIVRAIKTGKAPLLLLPPLVLHDRTGAKHTAEAEAIFRGEAPLPWH